MAFDPRTGIDTDVRVEPGTPEIQPKPRLGAPAVAPAPVVAPAPDVTGTPALQADLGRLAQRVPATQAQPAAPESVPAIESNPMAALETPQARTMVPKNHAMSYEMPPGSLRSDLAELFPAGTRTLDLTEAGHRTATTRSFPLGKPGDPITFEGRPDVYIVDEVRQIPETMDEAFWADWASREGWSPEHIQRVQSDPRNKAQVVPGAYQTIFHREDGKVQPLPAPAAQPPRSNAAPRPAEPPKRAVVPLISSMVGAAKKFMSDFARPKVTGTPGDAGSEVLTADSRVKIDEASVSLSLLLRMYREPGSGLRELMAADVDPTRMIADDLYARRMLLRFFTRNTVRGVCTKHPTTTESDAHARVIRAHRGPGFRVHPIVHALWNADFDGDAMTVSFDPTALAGARSAMDFLIATDGTNRIEPGFFGIAPWGSKERSTKEILVDIFGKSLTGPELDGLARAIDDASTGNVDAGFRSMLMWVRHIGNRLDPGSRDASTADVLTKIWRMNTQMRLASLHVQEMWGYVGPVLRDAVADAVEKGLDPAFEHLLSTGTPPSSVLAYGSAVGSPIGFVPKRNAHFRFVAGLTKIVKVYEADMFDYSPRSSESVVTAESHITKQMSGLAAFEDAGKALAQMARGLVLDAAGRPPLNDDAAFATWIERVFIPQYNFVANAVNSAVANWSLSGSNVGLESIGMPFIRTAKTADMRDDVRSQFLKIYGRFTMSYLFGNGKNCPRGWEDVRLTEYVKKNRESTRFLGTTETDYTKVSNFVGRLADLRTSFSHELDDRLVGEYGNYKDRKKREGVFESWMAHDKNGNLLNKTRFRVMAEARERLLGTDDQYRYDQDLNDLTEAFFLLGKEMFFFLGLHNVEAFLKSDIGRKFANANDVNQLGGVFYEAVARYRYEPIRLAEERITKASASGDADMLARATADLLHELEVLASSSDVWAAVVNKYRRGVNVFEDVLFSDRHKKKKDQMLNALVNADPTLRNTHSKYEVAYGLLSTTGDEYNGNLFSDNQGHTTLLDNINESRDKVNRWAKKNWEVISADVAAAQKEFGSGNQINEFLALVKANFADLVYMSPASLVDTAFGMDPTFAAGEKARQEQQASYSYQSVGYLVNGGTFSDVAVGGDLALGKMRLETFQSSAFYVAKVLTDPKFSITVYDETGVEQTMSMMAVFGTTDPKPVALWEWLAKHPRAAMALRKTTVRNTINNKTGFSYPIATMSLKETMAEFLGDRDSQVVEHERAMKVLADHPGFGAMLTLTVALTGKTREQARHEAIPKVGALIDLIRGMSGWRGSPETFVYAIAEAQGLPVDDIARAYEEGEAIEERLENATSLDDVRYTGDYQMGQLLTQLANDLKEYSIELEEAGFPPLEDVDLDTAIELFNLNDADTQRAFFRARQELSGAKTAQSTSVNGAMSKLLAGLMVLSRHTPGRCDAPAPEPIPMSDFRRDWRKYEGMKAWVKANNEAGEEWIPVNEVNVHHIAARSENEQVLIEQPATCTASPCACIRHATADPSTNFGRNQSAAVGRFLTVIRSLSTEGLNLKVATVGDDGTDSITKFKVLDIIRDSDAKLRVSMAFTAAQANGADPMAAARTALARVMQKTFRDMKYSNELKLNDYVNVAQILCRPVLDEQKNIVGVNVLSVGQVAAIINNALRNYDRGMTMEQFVTIATGAIDAFDLKQPLGVESVLAGVRVATQMPYSSQIIDQRLSSTERNVELMMQIAREMKAPPLTNYELDQREKSLLSAKGPRLTRWASLLQTWHENQQFIEKRSTLRIVQTFLAGDAEKDVAYRAIGPQNAWVIDAQNKQFVEAMVAAYRRGVTILLQGTPTDEQWDDVREKTGRALDKYQGRPIYEYEGMDPGFDTRAPGEEPVGTLISTFDIRLNGGNTMARKGAFDAGVFHAFPRSVSFFVESVANELGLSDSEFAACKSWIESITFDQTGDYAISPQTAFAGFIGALRRAGVASMKGVMQEPRVVKMSPAEISRRILVPYMNPAGELPLDLGHYLEEGSSEETRMDEAIRRYISRIDEVDPETGLLMTGKPGEILGWLAASWGDQVRYHPIRLFETANAAGAPAEFTIVGNPEFNEEKQELVIEWSNNGTMENRTFKLFEDLYSADKFIGRPRSIPDIMLDSGLKLAGMIARQSTVSRRLFMRRPQLMNTLMYMARMEPFGYNLAEHDDALADNPDLKERLLSGGATIEEWVNALGSTDIDIFPDDPDLNVFANHMAREAIKYNVNPTVVFASRYTRGEVTEASNLWFNFQVLFGDDAIYHRQLMRLMNRLTSPNGADSFLCPSEVGDERKTLFNSNLQVLVPVRYTDIKGNPVTKRVWADVYGGFHFFDEHFTGASNAGARTSTFGLAQAWANFPKHGVTDSTVDWFRTWFGAIDKDAFTGVITHARPEDMTEIKE